MSHRHSTFSRAVAWVFLLALFGFRGDLITGVTAQRADRSAKQAALKALTADGRVEPFSAAPRNPLELRVGRKSPVAAASPAAAGQPEPGGSGPEPGIPPAALANPVVNAADTTAHDTQSTAAIVRVLSGGSQVVVAAFNNTAVYNGSNGHLTGWARSIDNGANWTDGGALPASAGGDGGAPVLARDNVSGRIYLSTKAFPGLASAVQLFRSTNDGASWLDPINAAPGFGGGDLLDTPRVTVDNIPGTGQGNVYVVARNFAGGGRGSQGSGVYFSRSTDAGATFGAGPGLLLSTGGTGPTVVVGTDHAVYVFWWINIGTRVIRFVKSTNLGASFGPITTAATLTGTGADGDLGLGGGFRTNSFPQVTVDPTDGTLFVVYNDKNGTDKTDIFIVSSENGGTNWDSSPFRLNNDPGTNDQFTPAVTFAPDGKHLMASWYDRRSDPGNSLIERWGFIATKTPGGCCSVGPNFRISTGSWPVAIGQDSYVPANYMGDYDQITAGPAFFWVPWGDNRLSDAAHTNQPDVRVARIAVTGPPRGDLDRDFQTDRTIFRPGTGVWYSALSSGGATATGWGVSPDVDVLADYDGDAKPDLAVWRTGQWFITQSSTNTVRVDNWGVSGDIPLAGDVDGDGKADLVIWRPTTGAWYAKLSGGGFFNTTWGVSGDMPLLADFDGDGTQDFVIFRPSAGVWYVRYPFGSSQSIFWGTTGDIPVAGDFDGDGKADAAVFRPTTGQWFVLNSSNGSVTTVNWGVSGDIPVSGDWDGDGRSDFTVFRPGAAASWFTQYATGGTAFLGWGTTGDLPSGRRPGS